VNNPTQSHPAPAPPPTPARLTGLVVNQAVRHSGVVTRPEAARLGAGPRLLNQLVRSGVLEQAHPGVYLLAAVTRDHTLAVRAALAALTVKGDREAVASHASAAWLFGLIDDPPAEVHLTAGPTHRQLRDVVVHRATKAKYAPSRRVAEGVPCTTPARTLFDLAATATPSDLDDAADRGLAKRLVRLPDLTGELAGAPGRRGADQLRRCLARRGASASPAPSVLESRMGRLFKRFDLPVPTAEHVAGPAGEYRIDYAYAAQRVAIEVYGYAWHHSPAQMRRDLSRQRQLSIDGWSVLVFTWEDVTRYPERVAREIRAALSADRQERHRPA
jgi:hypothetical protein